MKLVERGGEVHVAVRSADPVLTSDLRARVHDLVGGLEKSGLRAETWQPGDSVRPSSQPGAQQQPGEDPRRQGRNPYSPDDTPQRRAPSSGSNNSEWIEQMSAVTGADRNK